MSTRQPSQFIRFGAFLSKELRLVTCPGDIGGEHQLKLSTKFGTDDRREKHDFVGDQF